MTMRHGTRALPLAIALIVASAASAEAQERFELFDAHMHWNQEPDPFYSLEQILAVFKRNGVTGILATSRPNKGTHQLVDAKPVHRFIEIAVAGLLDGVMQGDGPVT